MHRFRRLLVFPVLLGVLLTVASFRLNTLPASAGTGLVTQNCSTVATSVTICTDTFAQTFSSGTSINVAFQGGAPGVNVTCNAPSGITCTVSGGNSGATVVCQVTCQSGSSFVVVLPGGATQYFTMGGGAPVAGPYTAPITSSYVNPTPVGSITVGNPSPSVNVTVQTNPCPTGGYQVIVTVTCSGYGSGYGSGGGLCVGGSIPTNYGCTGASVIPAPYTYSYAPLYGYGGGCGYGGGYGGYGYGGYGGYGYGGYGGGYGGYGGGCGGSSSSCGYGYVYAGGCGGGCSVFVFSCGISTYNFGNCGGSFGGFGGFGCNGFSGGFFGNAARNCNVMNSAACFIRQGNTPNCPGGTTWKFSGGVWGCF